MNLQGSGILALLVAGGGRSGGGGGVGIGIDIGLVAAQTQTTTFFCPPPDGSQTVIPIDDASTSTVVRIPIVLETDALCTLVLRDALSTTGNGNGGGGGGNRVPVARSYDGRDWEVSAGHFSASVDLLAIDCDVEGGSDETHNTCDVTLPPTHDDGREYVLESFERPSTTMMSNEAKAARFLEQATFGSTRESITDLVNSGLDYERWAYEQMIELPPSTLRELYRRNTNPKYEMPWALGAVGSGPCDLYSRWRTYAISSKDMIEASKKPIKKYLTFDHIDGIEGHYVWRVDGQFRTVTPNLPTAVDADDVEVAVTLGTRYKIENVRAKAWMGNCVGCPVWISLPGQEMFQIANPVVSFAAVEEVLSPKVIDLPFEFKSTELPSIESSDSYPLYSTWIHADENALLNTTSLMEEGDGAVALCDHDDGTTLRVPLPWDEDGAQTGTFPSIFARSSDGVEFLYDRHLTLKENTVESPMPDGGGQLVLDTFDTAAGEGVKCHNVERNFYNEDHCILSTLSTACPAGPDAMPREVIVLDDANLAGIRELTGRSLYAVSGLELSTTFNKDTGFHAPCFAGDRNQWSRWVRDPSDDATDCENVEELGPGTYALFRDMVEGLVGIGERNENVVDVDRDHRLCDPEDEDKVYLGKIRAPDGACWHHVHIDEMNVYDLTGADPALYTIDGNIATFGSTEEFENNVADAHVVIGRLGDRIEVDDSLPAPLNSLGVQNAYRTLEYNPDNKPVLVCGSPEEVASDPFLGDNGFDVIAPENSGLRSMSRWELSGMKNTVWTHLALNAPDQLRQKMAWSLSQIVSVGSALGRQSHDDDQIEGYLAFYDMFVKNGFGSYRNLMREFSFSVVMAEWLSFKENRSLQYNLDKNGNMNYPDENFAREIMQLFTVGLFKLNMDGSIIRQANGNPEDTYSIEDIVSMSRAWTGFVMRRERGGAVAGGRQRSDRSLDPMMIDIKKRDWFPKNDLAKGFIGDKVALCVDLPSKHFIRKGAKYILLGGSGMPELHDDREWWTSNPDFHRLDLESTSPLYAKLCEADGAGGNCTFPAKVILDANLAYDAAAQASYSEYAVDTIRTIRMKAGSMVVWYEYVRQPCVEHAFYRDAKRVLQGQIKNDLIQLGKSMCANPKLEAATSMCSATGWESAAKSGLIYCHYQGERMTYSSAAAICEANGLEQSYPWTVKSWTAGPCQDGIKNFEFRSWAAAPCALQVKVAFDSGQIAFVHSPGTDRAGVVNIENLVAPDTLNFFAAPWEGEGEHPTLSDCLAIASCYVHGDEYCICNTDASESQVFSSASEVSAIEDLMTLLHVGAVDPATFDVGTYTSLGDCDIQDVIVYSPAGDCVSLSPDTVFAFVHNNKQFFLKNSKSIVSIPESSFSFRNPAQFISLSDPEGRDAYYETEEVLDSLFYDPSHAPFMAVRVIQRFGLSNPSPGFIERVATAYTTGSFGQFGSNKYGDLGAMVAAILLDDESRSVVLDADQTHGHLREPLIKVLSFFRSMGLHYESPLRIPTLSSLRDKIGQGSFEYPSVFSFFLPEFSPPGGVQVAGLVAPEAMVLQGDNVLFLLDAYFSTVKFGIVDCYKMASFESWMHTYPFDCPSEEGDSSFSPAKLAFTPQSPASVDDMLDELDVLLTSGRLQGGGNRALIKSLVEPLMEDVTKAVRAAQQLILSTPEYHSTNLPRKQDSARVITGYTEKPKASYKAVVVLMMTGGCDSWNLLVPKGQCTTADAYEEYVTARGTAHAIPKTNLTSISAEGSGQDCTEFGVNKNFGILAELYNANQAVFFANTGVINKPLTKHDNWEGETSFRPFAHNTMKHAFYTADLHDSNTGTGVMGRILDVLKRKGLQTSANDVQNGGIGLAMLTGDQKFNNPVYTVSTKSPIDLNKLPTVENLIDVVKLLNGVGETGNSVLGEYWSSRVAASLFEHELMHEIADIPEFEITDYPVNSEVRLTSRLKAVAGYMKSREYRKVNRDVFVVTQGGYDMHLEDGLADKFQAANGALADFIQEVRDQGLWDSTVIVMGSDFGRSMNANSNSGTDHAWGGNYFMAGGSVKGGQVLGKFPTPLGPESDYWLGRGRWIPTTPWDSIWNAVAQWLGVHEEEDLDWILPNRESFKSHALHSMCDLFTDKALFVDGACECIEENGIQYTMCDDITYAPTGVPTESPSSSPTQNPTTPPTASPSELPSSTPTMSPSENPTADLPDDGVLVKNIISPGSTVTSFGCVSPGKLERIFDSTTLKFFCDRTGKHNETTGIIINPGHGQLSIVKALRVYAPNNNKNGDIVSYNLEGRINATEPWVELHQGDLPWIDYNDWNDPVLDRNDRFLSINSTYEEADQNLSSTEVNFHGHGEAYLEYKLSYEARQPTLTNGLQYAEIELPGMVSPPEPSVSPTKGPTLYPTARPTDSPTADLPDDGMLVSTIFTPGSLAERFGCNNTGTDGWRIRDGTTYRDSCRRTDMWDQPAGYIITPEHGKLSIAKGLRLYPGKNCRNCDPLSFVLEGRVDSESPWVELSNGDFPLVAEGLDRNVEGLQINSTYDHAAPNLNVSEVLFPSNDVAYLNYKLTFEMRLPTSDFLRIAEMEMPGMLLPPAPSVTPTRAPSTSPTKLPTVSPTVRPTNNPTADLPDNGSLVANILTGSSVTHFGCVNTGQPGKSVDGKTDKWYCDRTGMHNYTTGLIFSPGHGQQTIAKAMRLYPANWCKNCDPHIYSFEGRTDAAAPWVEIDSGEFPGVDAGLERNPRGLVINSDYENADPARHSSEVDLHSHGVAFLEYRFTVVATRNYGTSNTLHLAELEIPGMILPAV